MDKAALIRRAASISVAVAFVLLVVKVVASEMTGSLAVWSDAMESIVHIASLCFMWYAVRLAQEPPDKNHPYGHGKVESFSVGLEGSLIVVAGLAVMWSVVHSIWHPNERGLQRLDLGILLILAGAIVNTVLGVWLVRTGKNNDSMVIVADGHHILSDAWTSWGVVLGVIVVWLSEMAWIDKVIAVLVAIHLCVTGFKLVGKALAKLMDAADPRVAQKVIDAINNERDPSWVDIHALRVHSVGQYNHIDFHLVVPGDWTVEKAHNISHDLEHGILSHLGTEGSVIVHLDPQTDSDEYQEVFKLERALRDDHYDMHPDSHPQLPAQTD